MSRITYGGKRTATRIFLAISAFLLAVAMTVEASTAQYESAINDVLGTPTTVFKNNGAGKAINYKTSKSEYTSLDKLMADETAADRSIGEEGTVLLKNENQALPLSKGETVSVLGAGCMDFTTGGKGSGTSTYTGTSMKQALEDAGLKVNSTLWDYYKGVIPKDGSWRGKFGGTTDLNNNKSQIGEIGWDKLPENVRTSVKPTDIGILMLTRTGGEGVDLTVNGVKGQDFKHYLELNDAEKSLLSAMKKTTKKQILVLNVNNAVGLSFLDSEEYGIDACVWIGGTGNMGINGLANVLVGKANPSGRLVDTWASSSLSSAAMPNSNYSQWTNVKDVWKATGSNSNFSSTKYDCLWNDAYLVEQEGLYVGYKYYETRYEDSVLGQGNANGSAGCSMSPENKWNYSAEVKRPFGFGLSYTTFAQHLDSVNYNSKTDQFEVAVTVKNTGSLAGKNVVEVYAQSPYTDYDRKNLVEKSAVQLVGFAKTKALNAGESQTVTVLVNKRDMASYDYMKAKTYIFEAGTKTNPYYLAIGTDAHDATNNILAAKGKTKDNGMDKNGDASQAKALVLDQTKAYSVSETGAKIKNQLDDDNINYYGAGVKYLTRSDWQGTYPKSQTLTANSQIINDLQRTKYTPKTDEADKIKAKYGANFVNGKNVGIPLLTMRGASFNDDGWNKILDEMSLKEMADVVSHGYHRVPPIQSVNKPEVNCQDGPTGFSKKMKYAGTDITCHAYPAEVVIGATWNTDLSKAVGKFVGEDGIWSNVYGWYAPAINIHRTPYSGRNFEYFSEDSIFNGKMATPEVLAAVDKGLEVYTKHFAFNDQENHRNGLCTFNNEQAFRESYLRAFEYAVVQGKATGIMATEGRVGCTFTGMDTNLMVNILRKEWGFKGILKTDMFRVKDPYYDPISSTVNTNIMYLSASGNEYAYDAFMKYAPTDLKVYTALRNTVKYILYTSANDGSMNGISTGSTIVKVTPWWVTAIHLTIIISAIMTVLFAALMVLLDRKQGRNAASKDKKRTVGFYLTSLSGVLSLVACILYITGVGASVNAAIVAMLILSVVADVFIAVKSLPYIDYAAAALNIITMVLFFETEAGNIGQCYYGLETHFTVPYVVLIALIVIIPFVSLIATIFRQIKVSETIHE
jgi:beta-glucosidase